MLNSTLRLCSALGIAWVWGDHIPKLLDWIQTPELWKFLDIVRIP